MPSLDRNNNMAVELESVNFKLASGCLSTILRKFNKKPGTFPTLLWPLSNCEVNRLQWSFGSAYTRPDDPLMLVNTDRLRPCRSEISDDACWLGIRKTKRPKKPQGLHKEILAPGKDSKDSPPKHRYYTRSKTK